MIAISDDQCMPTYSNLFNWLISSFEIMQEELDPKKLTD